MSLAILFHFLCAQHVSDINISIIRSVRPFCWITTLVVLFLVRCVLEFRCGWVGMVSVLQAGCKLLMMDILMSETCWAHKKWNEIASDIKLVLYSSEILYYAIFRITATAGTPQKLAVNKTLALYRGKNILIFSPNTSFSTQIIGPLAFKIDTLRLNLISSN